jgi:hypothetical protein
MKGLAILITTVNLGVLGVTMIMASEARKPDPEPGLSIAAVADELKSVGAALGSRTALHASCAEKRGDGMAVVGRADYTNDTKLSDGFPVTEATELSYRARVDVHCHPYNPLCYDVESIEVDGKRNTVPRI